MRGWVVVALLASACVFDATGSGPGGLGGPGGPDEIASTTDAGTSAAEAPTTGAPLTTDGASSAASTGGDETAALDDTGASTSSAGASTGEPDATTTGDDVPPGPTLVPAALATCVFLPFATSPYAGPAVCNGNAVAQNASSLVDLMMIDTDVSALDGNYRAAYAFLRFDVPAELVGHSILTATLHVQVADTDIAGGAQTGYLFQTGPFDANTLNAAPPVVLAPLAVDMGAVGPDQPLAWQLPANLVVPGQPLFLGLVPGNSDGVIYRGTTSPGAPTLELTLQ